MAQYNKKKLSEKLLLHGILISFSLVFIFPFLWMVFNSMKVQDEMATEKFRLLPKKPNVVMKSPYFAVDEFEATTLPEGIPEKVWKATLPEIEKIIDTKLESWTPELPGEDRSITVSEENLPSYKKAMQRGIVRILTARISDEARGIALEIDGKEGNPETLSDSAVQAGKSAIIADVEKILNNDIYSEIFNRVFRRICLGEIKLRMNQKIENATSSQGWQLEKGNVKLTKAVYAGNPYLEADIDYENSDEILFSYKPEVTDTSGLDRLYVSYRGDASWARIYFEVIKNGTLYRTSSVLNLFDKEWAEMELRWPDANRDKLERVTYYLLEKVGDVENKTDFQVRIRIVKSNMLTAWYDKALRNYRTVFREVPFARYIMTSISLCIINIVFAVFSCTFVAYAFARLEWPGRDIFFGIMIATMMVPAQVVMIPNFLINRYLGFYNTLIPLWLYSAFGAAFFIFLLRQFMKTVPKSLEEAARIDGCGFLGIYWHVILPLLKPTVATIAIYTFTGCWNNFMGPLIYVNDESLFPLALGLFKFNLMSGADTGLMMAGSFMMTMPIIILFFFAQKYFIQGITLTGTKG